MKRDEKEKADGDGDGDGEGEGTGKRNRRRRGKEKDAKIDGSTVTDKKTDDAENDEEDEDKEDGGVSVTTVTVREVSDETGEGEKCEAARDKRGKEKGGKKKKTAVCQFHTGRVMDKVQFLSINLECLFGADVSNLGYSISPAVKSTFQPPVASRWNGIHLWNTPRENWKWNGCSTLLL